MAAVLVICGTSYKLEAVIGTNIPVLLSSDWQQRFNQPKIESYPFYKTVWITEE